jgi:hypothetical protein
MQWTGNWSETETGTPHAGGVADEWVTQLLRQVDAKVFKKYSQMKLQMKREALTEINRQAIEGGQGGWHSQEENLRV